ncbi:MAG: 3-dehydroquinate synthase [Chloroflexota bacterium]|nr:3-dehydroquinate synthase [Chloroflexota bacterium]
MKNIILTGFAGTGKTVAGQAVATLLGWSFLDTDDVLERLAGKSVEAVFADDGEGAFRVLESKALAEVCNSTQQVISTGGGMVIDPANQSLMRDSGFVVCLEASAETIIQRLFSATSENETVRPLLQGDHPLERAVELKAERAAAYAQAHWTVHTDNLSVQDIAREVVRAARMLDARDEEAKDSHGADLAAVVRSATGPCPVYAGIGLIEDIGAMCRNAGLTSTAYVISDSNVFYTYGRKVQMSLEAADIPVHTFVVPAGETSKSVETLEACYQWLAEQRAERSHFIVAVGGGVIGDLAGFAAATFNRGLPVVQVPTSLAAMVDASIGGKTAINLSAGKNLVGAFYQPRMVLADAESLVSLPERERAAGWSEAVKHGLILDADLFQTFEEYSEAITNLEQPLTSDVVRRSMAVKADVVTRDERETLGLRILLNYGHTIGHGLETATEYGSLLHGEAVAIGMTAAVRISRDMGLIDDDVVSRQDKALKLYGLPTRMPGADREAIRRAMSVDKKTTAGNIRWVLLEGIGYAVTRNDVPEELVQAAIAEVT